jgi:hypothetical protein
MTRHLTSEAALARAFDLAQRLCAHRPAALTATRRAWALLDVAVSVQDKRLYYHPRVRDRQPLRSKVFLGEAHLLQRLVCAEAEKAAVANSQRDFTAIFVAAVVRRALDRNSFHAALAVTRVLHDYTTREGMLVYAGLVQDRQRARKRQLMSELLQCYGERLESCHGARGEERFAVVDDVSPLVPLVQETLTALTPWDTRCVVPEKLDSSLDGVPQLAWSGDAGENDREVQRMHALVHPSCFQRLATTFGLEAPAKRLAIPRLLCSKADDDEIAPPSPLDERERATLLAEAEGLARRRRQAPNAHLSLLVDGVERGRIEPEQDATCRVAIGAEAERIEVTISDAPGNDPLLLAWLPFEREAATDALRPLQRKLTLEGGQQLTFVVTPAPDANPDHLPTAEILVTYQETALSRRLSLSLRRLMARRQAWVRWPVVRPILVPLAVLGLAVMAVRLVPWPISTGMPVVSPALSDRPAVRPLSSPEPQPQFRDRRRQAPSDTSTRALAPRPVGVSLPDARAFWLDVAGTPTPAHSAITQQMADQLAASGLALSKRADEADAAIEIELLRTPATAHADDPDAHWRLRVVNATGATLWPTPGPARDYRGPLSRAVPQMARDLRDAVATARQKQAHRSDRP